MTDIYSFFLWKKKQMEKKTTIYIKFGKLYCQTVENSGNLWKTLCDLWRI